MSALRSALMTQILELVDATSGTSAWTSPQVRSWLGDVHWDEWANLLNRCPYLKFSSIAVTEDANGQFQKAALDVTTADAMQTHFRILALYDQSAGGTANVPAFYQQSTFRMYPTPQPAVAFPFVWTELGDAIQVQPVNAGRALTCAVNWRPTRADLLTADTVSVDFPAGYESVLTFETAARMLLRAGRETPAAMDLKRQAMAKRQGMLRDLGRIGLDPMRLRASDDLGDWASG